MAIAPAFCSASWYSVRILSPTEFFHVETRVLRSANGRRSWTTSLTPSVKVLSAVALSVEAALEYSPITGLAMPVGISSDWYSCWVSASWGRPGT